MRYLRSRYFLVPALAAVVFVLVLTGLVACAVPGQARSVAAPPPGGLPYMGYNTWYEFGTAIDESRVLTEAHYLNADGLNAEGYGTVVLDDGWQGARRTASGQLTWNTHTFPHGIPWLAGVLRSEGLNLGIYTAIGAVTCSGKLPASGGHYAQDAATFASWGVGFVKVDLCQGGLPQAQLTADYRAFCGDVTADGMACSEELPVAYRPGSAAWLAAVRDSSQFAAAWRVADDERWPNSALFTISSHLADDVHLHAFARPGHWNDLDLLVPGTVDAHPFRWDLAAEQSQLGVWAMEASPLFLSTNLAKLTPAELAAVQNTDMIGIDQSGAQAARALYSGSVTALVKPYRGGYAVLLYNAGAAAHAYFSLAGLTGYAHAGYANVWTGRTGTVSGGIAASLAPGQSLFITLKLM